MAKLIAKKKERNQQHQVHLTDLKRLSVASEPDRATDGELQGPTTSSAREARDSSGVPPGQQSDDILRHTTSTARVARDSGGVPSGQLLDNIQGPTTSSARVARDSSGVPPDQ